MRINLLPYKFNNDSKITNPQTSFFGRTTTLSPLAKDTVSFSASAKGISLDSKDIKHLHCPYCGREMMTDQEVEQLLLNVPLMKGDQAVSQIKYYTNRLRKNSIESQVATRLCGELQKNKNLTVAQTLKNLVVVAEDPVIKQQSQIYTNILKTAEKLPEQYQNQIKAIIPNPDIKYLKALPPEEHYIFKRKTLINNITEVYLQYKKTDDDTYSDDFISITKESTKVPRAKDDADTFIVKYGNRSTEEFLKFMVLPLKSSADHLYLNKEIKVDDPCDLVASCYECNTARGDTSFQEWMNKDPVHFNNFVNHLSELKDVYAETKDPKLKAYISQVTITAMRSLAEQNYLKLDFGQIEPENKFNSND